MAERLAADAARVAGLRIGVLSASYPAPLGQHSTGDLAPFLELEAPAPVSRSEEIRQAVRDLLRRDGYKPTGRGKPASEYLVGAARADRLRPINPAVDACNAVSLHSGLPISVVDLGRVQGTLRLSPGRPDERYVFNASGQEIQIAGLLCLRDDAGACATPVRDSQRTKTHDGTTETVSVVWAPDALAAQLDASLEWYAQLVRQTGARVQMSVA